MKLKRPTVKAISVQELCRVVSTNSDGRTVGLSYGEALANIRRRRVEERGDTVEQAARTNRRSLNWYAKEILAGNEMFDGAVLPRIRPRTDWAAWGLTPDGEPMEETEREFYRFVYDELDTNRRNIGWRALEQFRSARPEHSNWSGPVAYPLPMPQAA